MFLLLVLIRSCGRGVIVFWYDHACGREILREDAGAFDGILFRSTARNTFTGCRQISRMKCNATIWTIYYSFANKLRLGNFIGVDATVHEVWWDDSKIEGPPWHLVRCNSWIWGVDFAFSDRNSSFRR